MADHRKPVFKTARELKEHVAEYAKTHPCTCDDCSPHLYRRCSNQHSYFPACLDRNQKVYGQMRESMVKPRSYEALHLVRNCVASFDHRDSRYISSLQLTVLERLRAAYTKWEPGKLEPGQKAMSPDPIALEFTELLSTILFLGRLPKIRIFWEVLPRAAGGYSEQASDGPYEIHIDPKIFRAKDHAKHYLWTLLHECSHVFLDRWTCPYCQASHYNIGSTGHGRAWQMLASKLESVAEEILDIPFYMHRFPSMTFDILQDRSATPSLHDLELHEYMPDQKALLELPDIRNMETQKHRASRHKHNHRENHHIKEDHDEHRQHKQRKTDRHNDEPHKCRSHRKGRRSLFGLMQ